MDKRSALERLNSADHVIGVLVRKLGGYVEITENEMREGMQSRSTIVGHSDPVSGNYVLKLVEPQGGVQ